MKHHTALVVFVLFAASGPALACTSDVTCEARPGDGRRGAAPVAPLSVPAPDAKAPERAGPPGTKTACATDADCSRPGDGRRRDEQTDEVRRHMACMTDNCGDSRSGK